VLNDAQIDGNLSVGGDIDLDDLTVDNITANIILVADNACIPDLQVDVLRPKTDDILVRGNLVPIPDSMWFLGNATNKWEHTYTDQLSVCADAVIEGNLTINGMLFVTTANLELTDPLILDTLCANTVQTTDLEEKTMGTGITVTGDLSPATDQMFTLGNSTNKWNELWVQDVYVCGTIEGNVGGDNVVANNLTVLEDATVCGNLMVDWIEPKVEDAINVGGNLRPSVDCDYDLGSADKQWGNVYAKSIKISSSDVQLGCLLYISDELEIMHAGGGVYYDLSTYDTVIGKVYYVEYRVTAIRDNGQAGFTGVIRGSFLNRGDGTGGGEIIRMNFTDNTSGSTGVGGAQYNARIVPTGSGGTISGNTITFQVSAGNRTDTNTWRSCISLYVNPEMTPVI
jgi:hypothetical protein